MTPLIYKGDKITCTNGHVIGEALEDVNEGDLNWGAKFGNWTQEDHPTLGDIRKPQCATCGAPFISERGWCIHFESGWKPKEWKGF